MKKFRLVQKKMAEGERLELYAVSRTRRLDDSASTGHLDQFAPY
ncbi:MAG: hypothetical protein O7G87_00225 [bacterium]|nr:hypothetical protein [bacterium]